MGSDEEAIEMDNELRRRNIRAEYFEGKGKGVRGYRLPAEDISKLPVDEQGPYFGNDDSGTSLKDEKLVLDLKADISTTDWIPI